MTRGEERLDEVPADEARATGDEDLHRRDRPPVAGCAMAGPGRRTIGRPPPRIRLGAARPRGRPAGRRPRPALPRGTLSLVPRSSSRHSRTGPDGEPGALVSTGSAPSTPSRSRARDSSRIGSPPIPTLPSARSTVTHRRSPGNRSYTDRASAGTPPQPCQRHGRGRDVDTECRDAPRHQGRGEAPGSHPTSSTGPRQRTRSPASPGASSEVHTRTGSGVTEPESSRWRSRPPSDNARPYTLRALRMSVTLWAEEMPGNPRAPLHVLTLHCWRGVRLCSRRP